MSLNVLLSGVVGSNAYGLATATSDVDRLGVYAAPTMQLLGLRRPIRSIVTTDPDVTMHELGKWCTLALNGNPTVTELVWLDEHDVVTPLGGELIGLRQAFLSSAKVRTTYLGYAFSQLKWLQDHPGAARAEKHGRHIGRLLKQGLALYRTGELKVRLDPDDADWCRRVGELAAAGQLDQIHRDLDLFKEAFERYTTMLPGTPDYARVDAWLRGARLRLLDRTAADIEFEEATR